MSGGREEMLGALRRSLKRGPLDEAARAPLEARLSSAPRGLVPARGAGDRAEQVDLFESMATEVSATVERLPEDAEVPGAIARYLKQHNLPADLKLAPNPELDGLPWDSEPLLKVRSGRAEAADAVSVVGAFAGVAETGSLMLRSGPESPTTLNFLPENHIVVLKASTICGAYEEAWDKLREAQGRGTMPRTVSFVTGPSRTADVEQKLQLGAHGPRRLHILLIEDGDGAAA